MLRLIIVILSSCCSLSASIPDEGAKSRKGRCSSVGKCHLYIFKFSVFRILEKLCFYSYFNFLMQWYSLIGKTFIHINLFIKNKHGIYFEEYRATFDFRWWLLQIFVNRMLLFSATYYLISQEIDIFEKIPWNQEILSSNLCKSERWCSKWSFAGNGKIFN
jgi:hypothetical protein